MSISAITLFCDDIRYEHDGKRTLVGVHQDARVGERYPLNLPQLFIITYIRCLAKNIPDWVAITISQTGQEDETLEVPAETLAQSRQRAAENRTPDTLVTFEAAARLSDLTISEALVIAVKVAVPEGEIAAGRLVLRAADDTLPDSPKQGA